MRRYDYDHDWGDRRRGAKRRGGYDRRGPLAGWHPGAYMAEAPMYGWGWWGGAMGWPPYAIDRHEASYEWRRRQSPRQSATYGRRGDRYARGWAERYGYDIEMTIAPRQRGRYDGY